MDSLRTALSIQRVLYTFTTFVLLWSLYQVRTMTSSHMGNWMVHAQWSIRGWRHSAVDDVIESQ